MEVFSLLAAVAQGLLTMIDYFIRKMESILMVNEIRKLRVFSLGICLILFSSLIPINPVSAQIPYEPEVDYNCDSTVWLHVGPWSYGEQPFICTVSNNNAHDVTVEITKEWAHQIEGPLELSDWGYCTENEIGDDIYVGGNSYVSFCFMISAESKTPEGIENFGTSAEVKTYSLVIPCDNCQPVDEDVDVIIMPWITVAFEDESAPESAYDYHSTRTSCDKKDSSELTIEITTDGNYEGSAWAYVEFEYDLLIYDLYREEYVEHRESKFGNVELEFNSDLDIKAGETVSKTFSASWDIKDNDDYDIQLRTEVWISIGTEDAWDYYQEIYRDNCPKWEGVLPDLFADSDNQSSGITVNLSSPFSSSLSIISVALAAIVISRKRDESN